MSAHTDDCLTDFNLRLPSLTLAQTNYAKASKGGVFFQGLCTHSATPGTVGVVPDKLASKPTDQAETWIDMGLPSVSLKYSIQSDAYNGKKGMGYVWRLRTVDMDGSLKECAIGVGPHASEYDTGGKWLDVTPPP